MGLGPEEIDRARVARDRLTHRGPDQAGESIANGVYLGHRRLSILDLSDAGRQPMVSADGAVAIAVNGEIYNHRGLRAELGESSFSSHSDSEVVLHGYRAWGVEGLAARLDGMYAIVIHDRIHNKLHLVRDRVGIKPLYFGRIAGSVVCASELKAIVQYCGSGLEIDNTAAYDVLTYGYVPAPKTIYRDIWKLEPGSIATVSCNRHEISRRRYWSLPVAHGDTAAGKDAPEQLRALIDDAVESQLMSDVPVGFFLSGGLDSSIVLAHASRRHEDPVAYSIGYDNADHDETEYAKVVAEHVGARHVIEILGVGASAGMLDKIIDWYDEPFADTSALPTNHVSTLARRHSVVALTGDGGDELFGGYRWYRRFERVTCMQRRLGLSRRSIRPMSRSTGGPALTRRARVGSALDQLSRTDEMVLYSYLMGDRLPAEAKRRWRRELEISDDYDDQWYFRANDDPSLPVPKRLQALDFKTYLPDDILTKVDRASMAVSLEARVPLLATPLVEFAFSLSSEFHMAGGVLKAGLKQAYADVLPLEILHRPKRGFSVPLGAWQTSLSSDDMTLREAIVSAFFAENP